jgi:ribosomal protein L2
MSIRLYKSYTPGTRNRGTFSTLITKSKPEKSLIQKNHRNKGRNNQELLQFVIEVVINDVIE